MKRALPLILPLLLFTLAACESETDVQQPAGDVGTTDEATTGTGTTGMSTAGPIGAAAWDTNGDAFLSEDEFRTGYTGNGRFDTYDTDRSGALSEQEWTGSGLSQGQAFPDLDADANGQLSHDELARGLFRQYDRNGDQRLSADEYRDLDNTLGGTTGGTTPGMTPATPGTAPGTTTPGTETGTGGTGNGTGGTSY